MSFFRELFGDTRTQHLRGAKLASDAANPNITYRNSQTGVTYRLERVRRRSIGLVITTDGLVIRAPHWTPIYEIDAAIDERRDWVERSLEKQRARLSQLAELKDGGHLLFRGKRLRVEVRDGLFEEIDLSESRCVVTTANGAIDRARLDQELWAIASEELPELAMAMADAASLPLRAVKLSRARTLWGSCTIDGVVRLNFRLVQLPKELMRHVVAHELAHLVEFNHSKRFWKIVESIDAQTKRNRRAVKAYSVLLEL